MDLKTIFLGLSILFAFIAPVFGTYAIFKGDFKPQRVTRSLIFLVTVLFVATLLTGDDKNGIYIALIQLISTGLIFLLSLKFGVGGKSKSDILVFISALICLVLWQITDNWFLGLLLALLTDFIGFFPTLVKTYKKPETEEWKFYFSDILTGLFNTLSVGTLSFSSLVFPIYILALNLTMVLLIKRNLIFKVFYEKNTK